MPLLPTIRLFSTASPPYALANLLPCRLLFVLIAVMKAGIERKQYIRCHFGVLAHSELKPRYYGC